MSLIVLCAGGYARVVIEALLSQGRRPDGVTDCDSARVGTLIGGVPITGSDDDILKMRTDLGPLLALPYTFELNDVPIWAIQSQSSDELLKRLETTLNVYEREAQKQPRIVTFGLHPHIVGVPHRSYYLEKALDLLLARKDTQFVTSSEIADWFIKADGTGGRNLPPYSAPAA